MKKIILLITASTLALGSMAQAGSWGFTLGDGSSFQWGNSQRQQNYCAPVYSSPAYVVQQPVYYSRPVTYYQPQTVYMQPYQRMQPAPVYYSQPSVYYSNQPVTYRDTHNHCESRQVRSHNNRW